MTPSWPRLPIAVVSPLFAPAAGGVERHIERLTAGLRDRDITVEVVTTDPSIDRPESDIREGIRVVRFPTVRGDRIYFAAPLLARWLAAHVDRYALLHAHNLHTLVPLAATWAARRGAPPLVLTAHWHGTGHTPFRRALHVPYRPVAAWVARRSRAMIANSEAEAELLRQDLGIHLPISVVHAGIELPGGTTDAGGPPPGQDPDGLTGWTTVLSVGRLERYKGVELMVDALRHLPATVRLVVIGHGPAEGAIRAAAQDGGLSGRVILRGRVSDVELRAWYDRAALFVSMSAHEAFGLTILEAAAAGMPVVASDIPAHLESRGYLPDGRITIVARDAGGAALAEAVRSALARGRVSDRTGWALPTWDDLVEGTLDVYRSVLGGGRAHPPG